MLIGPCPELKAEADQKLQNRITIDWHAATLSLLMQGLWDEKDGWVNSRETGGCLRD